MSNYNPPDPLPPPLTIFNNVNWEIPDVGTGGGGGVGPQGIAGPIGPIGPQGRQGFQGLQGNIGVAGLQGNQGFVGNQGFAGNQGVGGTQGFQGYQGLDGVTGIGLQGLQGVAGGGGGGGDIVSFTSDVIQANTEPMSTGYINFRTMTVPALLTDGDYVDVFDTGYFLKYGGAPTNITIQYRVQRNGVPFFETQNVPMTGFTSADDFQCPYTLRMRLTRITATDTGFEGRFFCGSVAQDITTGVLCANATTNNASQVYALGTPHTLTFGIREDASTFNGQHIHISVDTIITAFIQN